MSKNKDQRWPDGYSRPLFVWVSDKQLKALDKLAKKSQRTRSHEVRWMLDEIVAGRSIESLADQVHKANNEIMKLRGSL